MQYFNCKYFLNCNSYNNKDFILKDNVITFISNNVKGIQTSQKRMKLFEYLKNYVATNGFVFIQETHSSIRDEKKWEDEFRGKLFLFLTEKQIHAEF